MEGNATIDWKTEEEFRENAYRFYYKCKKEIRMPYAEDIFIETVCAAFAVMKKGQKPNLELYERNAINAIIALNQKMTPNKVKTEIRRVINGSEIGEASDGPWFDLCCEFRRKATRQYKDWNEYCKAVSEKEKKFLSQIKRITKRTRDIMNLVITIELL